MSHWSCTPLAKPTATVLDAWIKYQGKDASRFLFPSTRGGRLSADAVQHLVAKHARAAQKICPSLTNKRVSPHTIRHYLPFRTMSGTGTPALFFRQMREVAHDIVLTPSISPKLGKGVPREVYYRLPRSSLPSAASPPPPTYPPPPESPP